MKFDTYNSVKQEISLELNADRFGGILGADVATFVAYQLPNTLPQSRGINSIKSFWLRIAKNIRHELIHRLTSDSFKACIS